MDFAWSDRLLLEQTWAHFVVAKDIVSISDTTGVSVLYLGIMSAHRNGKVESYTQRPMVTTTTTHWLPNIKYLGFSMDTARAACQQRNILLWCV